MSEKKISYEAIEDASSIKEHFSSILNGFEDGRLILTSDKEELVLYPQGDIKFSIKAKVKGKNSKMEIKISWKEEKEKKEPHISISS